VFKRANNIAKDAPDGEPSAPSDAGGEVHDSETALFQAYTERAVPLAELIAGGDYPAAFGELARFAPLMASYFDNVFVMADDAAVRDNRLRLMRGISETCSRLARLELLGG
jgi:glycyl-tRNA synthetase beta chain